MRQRCADSAEKEARPRTTDGGVGFAGPYSPKGAYIQHHRATQANLQNTTAWCREDEGAMTSP